MPDDPMEMWMRSMTPGPPHARLGVMVGTWTTESRFWMDGPGAEPSVSAGRCVNEWILGKRFIRGAYRGSFGASEFEGIGYIGFDNNKERYVGTWMDTMGTAIMYHEGSADAAGSTITLLGEFVDPIGRRMRDRNVLRLEGPDRYRFEMHHTDPQGREAMVGAIVYTRAKER